MTTDLPAQPTPTTRATEATESDGTDAADGADGWRPRPVRLRWPIGASAAAAVILGVSVWLGAFTPRLGIWESDAGYGVPATERTFAITNDAAAPVELVGLAAPEGTVLTSAVVVRSDQSSRISRRHPLGDLVDGSFSVPGGGSVNLVVTYRVVDCPTAMRHPGMVLDTRTFLGVSRSRTIGDHPMVSDTADEPWCQAVVP